LKEDKEAAVAKAKGSKKIKKAAKRISRDELLLGGKTLKVNQMNTEVTSIT
jgi:hypothetical protein